ncbi:MFS transporter [Archaeoglobus sp.]
MRTYRYRWAIFSVLSAIYFFVYFHRTSTAVLADEIMEEFAVSALAIGLMSSAYFYPYALLQIPVGILSDTKGPRKTTTLFTLIAFTGTLLFATSNSFPMAVFARFLIGVGVSGVYIPTIKALSQWFRRYEFATLTGILFAVGNMGALLSAYPLAMMAIIFGWRTAFLLIGFITLFLAITCWIVVRDSPQVVGLKPIEDVAAMQNASFFESFKTVIINKYLWIVAVSAFLRYGVTMGYQGLWGGPYLMDVYGLSRDVAGGILMMVGIGTIVGAPTIGYLSDRIFRTRKWFLVLGGIGFTASTYLLAFHTGSMNMGDLYLVSFLIGFFGGSGPVAYAYIKEIFPLRITGMATSIVNVFPFFGGALFQVIMGYLMDLVGSENGTYPVEAYALSFKFCFVAALIATIISLFIKESYE